MSDDFLRERLLAFASRTDDGDWDEVLRRAGLRQSAEPRRRRQRLTLIVAFALIALVVAAAVTAAVGLRPDFLSLFEDPEPTPFQAAAPAPIPVVKDFQMLDRVMPAGEEFGVEYAQARKVYERVLTPALTATVYAAPTKDGFCRLTSVARRGEVASRYPACHEATDARPIVFGVGGTGRRQDPRILSGWMLAPSRATEIELLFDDGHRDTVPLTWISEPIGAAFFVFPVPQETLVQGKRPTALIALDATGTEVAREDEVERSFAPVSSTP